MSFLLFFIFSFHAQASSFQIIGPCSAKPLVEIQTAITAPTLGDLTVKILNTHQIEFSGDRHGIQAILNSPVGDEALEVLTNEQMRAYGWCVSLDGKQPNEMPDQVAIKKASVDIVWFYAYALYDRGVWKNFCTPSYQVHTLPICQPSFEPKK